MHILCHSIRSIISNHSFTYIYHPFIHLLYLILTQYCTRQFLIRFNNFTQLLSQSLTSHTFFTLLTHLLVSLHFHFYHNSYFLFISSKSLLCKHQTSTSDISSHSNICNACLATANLDNGGQRKISKT